MSEHAVEYVGIMGPLVRTKGRGGPMIPDWRAECSCGWKGLRRILDTDAYEDGRRHLEDEQVKP